MPTRGFESVQVVAFFAGFPPVPNAAILWAQLFQEPYAQFGKPNASVTTASGVVDGVNYELQLHPSRVDVFVRPVSPQIGPPPVASNLEELSNPAVSRMNALIGNMTIVRQAVIATLHEELPDSASSVRKLLSLVPSLPVPDDAQDVTFQLSRRRSSRVQDGLKINRLCRWSTAIGVEMFVPIGDAQGTVNGKEHFIVESFYDINTHHDNRPKPGNVTDIYGELLEEIRVLAANGVSGLG